MLIITALAIAECKVNLESIHEMDLKFVSFIHWNETRNIAGEIS